MDTMRYDLIDKYLKGVNNSFRLPQYLQDQVYLRMLTTINLRFHISNTKIRSIDHKRNSSVFATSGETVQLWDHNRSKPIRDLQWGVDTAIKVKFNQVEQDVSLPNNKRHLKLILLTSQHIIAACTNDRGIFLADTRQNTTLSKLFLKYELNAQNRILTTDVQDKVKFTFVESTRSIYIYSSQRR